MGNHVGRRSVFYSWFLSYCAILAILVVLSFVVYMEARRVLMDEVEQAKAATMRQAGEAIGARIADLERLDLHVSLNPRLESFMHQRQPIDANARYTLAMLSRDFQVYKASYSFLRSFYVFFHESDTVLSSETTCGPELFYSMYMNESIATYREWIALMKGSDGQSFVTLQDGAAYIRSIPPNPGLPVKATLVILLDEGWLQQAIDAVVWNALETVALVDNQNRVVASTGTDVLPVGLRFDEIPDSGTLRVGAKRTTLIASARTPMADWRIVSILPNAAYVKRVNSLQTFTLMGLVLCLGVGIFLAYRFTRKNYAFISSVTREMAEFAGIEVGEGNEYQLLKRAVTEAEAQRSKNKDALARFNDTMRQNFLGRLIRGRFSDAREVEESFKDFGIVPVSQHWAVVAVYAASVQHGSDGRDHGRRLLSFLALNGIERLVAKRNLGLVTEHDDIILCVVNLAYLTPFEWNADLLSLAEGIRSLLAFEYGLGSTAAISSVVSGAESIPQAYQESLDALEYRLVLGSDQVIRYEDIKERGTTYQCSLETEKHLLCAVRSGDLREAARITGEVFDKNAGTDSSPQTLKCLVFDLYNLLLKATENFEFDRKREAWNIIKPLLDVLIRRDNPDEVRTEIVRVFTDICRMTQQPKRDERLAAEVKSFIAANYADVNLNIGMVADHFGMTQGYISKLFRDATGENLLEVIAETRVLRAKELIEHERMSLADVALQVGYGNANALIRAFKKQEGITPGKYRG